MQNLSVMVLILLDLIRRAFTFWKPWTLDMHLTAIPTQQNRSKSTGKFCIKIPRSIIPADQRQSRAFSSCSFCSGNATHGWTGASGLWVETFCAKCEKNLRSDQNRTNRPILKLNRRCCKCSRIASFGLPGGRTNDALHCSAHKLVNEQDLRHPCCKFLEGCPRRASFGEREGCLQFCGVHKLPHHVDTHHKRCRVEGCAKRALFGNGTGVPHFCKTHKSDQDRNLALRVCEHEGCCRTAFYGDTVLRRPLFCSLHRSPQHTDVVNKMCTWQLGLSSCTRQAFYGDIHLGATFCAMHRAPEHERVRRVRNPRTSIL